MNFLHFAIFLFVVCSVVLVVVSFAGPAPAVERLRGLTYATTEGEPAAGDRGWRRRDLVLTLALAALVGAVWWYFS
jgi:SSS family solute:Na+ symporter